jgi:hypothetical protein
VRRSPAGWSTPAGNSQRPWFCSCACWPGWGPIALHGGHLLAALLAGIVLLGLAVQGLQTCNLSAIYRLRPEARSW